MRGFFAIGSERMSKPMNLGALMRTAHAFHASFVFTVDAHHKLKTIRSADTAKSAGHLPTYRFETIDDMSLPIGMSLVGVELTDDAIELPSFRHPKRAAYILGPEEGSLSPEMTAKCDYVIKIPTKFCVNVSVAAALVMYDRMISMGGFSERPVFEGGPESEAYKNMGIRRQRQATGVKTKSSKRAAAAKRAAD